jgi:hypothetical protein
MDEGLIDVRRKRNLARIIRAAKGARQAKATTEAFRSLARPLDFLWRYGTGRGSRIRPCGEAWLKSRDEGRP